MQTLATMMMTYVSKPSLGDCKEVARSLVTSHPFLKDDEGTGEVSVFTDNDYLILFF